MKNINIQQNPPHKANEQDQEQQASANQTDQTLFGNNPDCGDGQQQYMGLEQVQPLPHQKQLQLHDHELGYQQQAQLGDENQLFDQVPKIIITRHKLFSSSGGKRPTKHIKEQKYDNRQWCIEPNAIKNQLERLIMSIGEVMGGMKKRSEKMGEVKQDKQTSIQSLKQVGNEIRKGIQLNKIAKQSIASIYFHYNLSVVLLKLGRDYSRFAECSPNQIVYNIETTVRLLSEIHQDELQSNPHKHVSYSSLFLKDKQHRIQRRLRIHTMKTHLYMKLHLMDLLDNKINKIQPTGHATGQFGYQQCTLALYQYAILYLAKFIRLTSEHLYNTKTPPEAISCSKNSTINTTEDNNQMRKESQKMRQNIQHIVYFIKQKQKIKEQYKFLDVLNKALKVRKDNRRYVQYKRKLSEYRQLLNAEIKWIQSCSLVKFSKQCINSLIVQDPQKLKQKQENKNARDGNKKWASNLLGFDFIGYRYFLELQPNTNQMGHIQFTKLIQVYCACLYLISCSAGVAIQSGSKPRAQKLFNQLDQSENYRQSRKCGDTVDEQIRDIRQLFVAKALQISKLYMRGSKIQLFIQQNYKSLHVENNKKQPKYSSYTIREHTNQQCEQDKSMQINQQQHNTNQAFIILMEQRGYNISRNMQENEVKGSENKQKIKINRYRVRDKLSHSLQANWDHSESKDNNVHQNNDKSNGYKKRIRIKRYATNNKDQVMQRIVNVYSSMSKRSKSSNANNQDDSKERPNFTPDMRRAPRVSPVKLLKFNFNNVMSNLLTNRNGQTQQSNSREKSRLYLNKEGKNIDIRSKIMINSIEAQALLNSHHQMEDRTVGAKYSSRKQHVNVLNNLQTRTNLSGEQQIDVRGCDIIRQNQKQQRKSRFDSMRQTKNS